MESQGTTNNFDKVGKLTLPDSKTHYKATVITTACYFVKADIKINGRVESPKINPHNYGQMIFDKSAKDHSKRKRESFQQIVLGKPSIFIQKNGV